MAWLTFKSLTISPAALFSVFGRARKTGPWKGGSAPDTMNFWNGANGSRRRSRNIALHDNAEFGAIYLRGVQSFTDLDAVSKLRFSAFLNRFFKNFEGMYFSHCDRILTESLWGEIERTMSDVIAYPGVQEWWKTRRHWHTEEFGRVVDAIIAKGDEPKAYSTYNLREIATPETGA